MALKVSNEGATVFNFYNVVDQSNKGMRDSIGITVGPDELITNVDAMLEGGARQYLSGGSRENTFQLMACDGYKLDEQFMDFVNKKGLVLLLSIPAGLVGQNKPSWTNKIEIALQEALDATEGQGTSFRLDGIDQDFAFADIQSGIALRNQLKDSLPSGMDGDKFVEQICASLTDVTGHRIEPTLISNSAFDRKMTWPEIKTLVDSGHYLISHGAKHTKAFTEMGRGEIQDDLLAAQKLFQEHLGQEAEIVTYPEGKYDPNVISAVQSVGIKTAFHMGAGVITSETYSMELPRVNVTQDMLTADM